MRIFQQVIVNTTLLVYSKKRFVSRRDLVAVYQCYFVRGQGTQNNINNVPR